MTPIDYRSRGNTSFIPASIILLLLMNLFSAQRSVSGGLIAFFLIVICLGAAFAMCKLVQRFNRRISTESDEAESQPQIQVLSVRSLEQVDDFVLERPPDVQDALGTKQMTGASESSTRAVADDPIESPPPDYATVTFDIPDVDSARNLGQQDGSSDRGVDLPDDNSGGNSEVQEDISARSFDLSEDNSGRHLEQRDDISDGSLSPSDSGSERSYDTRL
ncbi:hypothetical protein BSL78_18915 [Apostichopus japonicus]|uniref:Uncharacterized protein n=1 Tax=Stichopus japonicus TaxID=307972 RepID=A0A2G8K8D8_STIJA|nr:hypothetical protein BSL78_18915 [Apostichopus japonicus]